MYTNIIFIFKIILEGIIEGVTEFLPVSSTGHMIILGSIIGFKEGAKPASLYGAEYIHMFEIIIQLGAILAIVVLYWDKIFSALKPSNLFPSMKEHEKTGIAVVGEFFTKGYRTMPGFKFWTNIVVACIPAIVIGLPFQKKIDKLLFFPTPVAAALILGAIWIIFAENKYRKKAKIKSVDDITIKQAIIIGCFQCLALWPGMSRSASTIIGAWIIGVSTVAGAEFSFFLAIPMMLGASLLFLIKNSVMLSNIQILGLGVGFVVAFIVALIVVDKFISFLKKKPMRIFAVYRLIIGVIVLVLGIAKVIS
ncbi:undecaprenyl-diphosphate phosphatase [Clostridium felsineum]|uniref:Undecaprenyl-diphosphatase n=1 Tax=Clostridium felsineum TaxID=36839 RepID=A0A1S8KWS1_9CLOT|nr:undecaprenyl-diphosphate phosphatase [Clostridium felsineum]MCR3761896.1 undecaprenyl-diphosphate phosphatase [Clostridium felsineum]URZ01401.1 Undecaprenyl-diphosphatase [Clostridium felsineum]URZ05755.1 Undecaprenyl-diphosphatase [Clostridium felsineum]URZ10794.1 Undecaprenyl-diphosphatase [Clostridium felsineum]